MLDLVPLVGAEALDEDLVAADDCGQLVKGQEFLDQLGPEHDGAIPRLVENRPARQFPSVVFHRIGPDKVAEGGVDGGYFLFAEDGVDLLHLRVGGLTSVSLSEMPPWTQKKERLTTQASGMRSKASIMR